MKDKLLKLLGEIDILLSTRVAEARAMGGLAPQTPVEVKIVGQMALILGNLSIPVASTMDLDAIYPNDYAVTSILRERLLTIGIALEVDNRLIWMPKATVYGLIYSGRALKVLVAEPLYVIASKCKFRRTKDKNLVAAFFSAYPHTRKQIEAMGIATEWVK